MLDKATMSLDELYRSRTPGSARLYAEALTVLPGGVTHSNRYWAPYPLHIDHASGCRITDVDGNEYIDYWVANGTMFVTLEDEHGMVNVVVWAHVAQRRRKALLGASLLAVRGRWEQVDGVAHLIAQDMQDLSEMLGGLRTSSRDFH